MIFNLGTRFELVKRFISILIGIVICFGIPSGLSKAQDGAPSEPIYVVQEGDTLWDISRRFNVTIGALIQANRLSEAAVIKPGDALVIPGLTGISGRLETHKLGLGETLISLSRDFGVAQDILIRLNHLVSPNELYVGRDVIVPVKSGEANGSAAQWERLVLEAGQSALEASVLYGVTPWHIALGSGLTGTATLVPGDVLRVAGKAAPAGSDRVGALPPPIQGASVENLPLVQGRTAVVRVTAPSSITIQGELINYPLNFFYSSEGDWVALQGVHARTEPGLYLLSLRTTLPTGVVWAFSQRVRVVDGDYPFDPDLPVDPATIAPEVTQPENEQWAALTAPVTAEKLWEGMFFSPVDRDFAECYSSLFGNRRSYNQSGYLYFHTGLDFCGSVGNAIYAPAAGEVVFQGPLTVRGNATVINHGWGVYTAYMHQSEILVQVSERVEAGQLIGRVGATGRVSGPHLHFEVWVGGVQVDPLEWLQREFP